MIKTGKNYKTVIVFDVMDPQCEIVGKYVLPVYRSLLAKELVLKYHLSQTESAKKLGTTQAAISQYLSSKRAFKGMEHVEQYLPQIQIMAEVTAKKLFTNQISSADITLDFCKLCSTFCSVNSRGGLAPEYYI